MERPVEATKRWPMCRLESLPHCCVRRLVNTVADLQPDPGVLGNPSVQDKSWNRSRAAGGQVKSRREGRELSAKAVLENCRDREVYVRSDQTAETPASVILDGGCVVLPVRAIPSGRPRSNQEPFPMQLQELDSREWTARQPHQRD